MLPLMLVVLWSGSEFILLYISTPNLHIIIIIFIIIIIIILSAPCATAH